MEFTIFKYHQDKVEAKINELARRAVKLGMTPPTLTVVREYKAEKTYYVGGKKKKGTFAMLDVQLEGDAPKIDGWKLRAVIEHDADGLTILRGVPGTADLPHEYRDADPTRCDHCHIGINRKTLYIIEDEAGQLKQVGNSCLKDFLGNQDPAIMLATAEFLWFVDEYLEGDLDADFWQDLYASHTSLYRFMRYVAFAIRLEGWVSQSMSRDTGRASTVNSANYFMDQGGLKDRSGTVLDKPNEADEQLGRQAIEWAATQIDPATCSDYEFNIHQIAATGMETRMVHNRKLGYAASIIPAYMKATEQLNQKEATQKAHVGTIGKRQVFSELTLTAVYHTENRWGATHIHKFQDADGNDLTWFTGSYDYTNRIGETFSGKATVKDHTEYKGTPQTIITRFKVD